MVTESFDESVNLFLEQENLTRTEGRKGIENLCQLVGALGYKDPMRFGQFSHLSSFGDLFEFLEDNPGCIEAITSWIADQNVSEWKENIDALLNEEEEYEEE